MNAYPKYIIHNFFFCLQITSLAYFLYTSYTTPYLSHSANLDIDLYFQTLRHILLLSCLCFLYIYLQFISPTFLYLLPFVLPMLSTFPSSTNSANSSLTRDSFTCTKSLKSAALYHTLGCMAPKIAL